MADQGFLTKSTSPCNPTGKESVPKSSEVSQTQPLPCDEPVVRFYHELREFVKPFQETHPIEIFVREGKDIHDEYLIAMSLIKTHDAFAAMGLEIDRQLQMLKLD